MATIDLDLDDHASDLSDDVIAYEFRRRLDLGRISPKTIEKHVEPWTPHGLAADLRTAFYARNASRFEILLGVLETHEASR